MTTIVIDVTKGKIASDRQRSQVCKNTGELLLSTGYKIYPLANGEVFTGTGNLAAIIKAMNYYVKHGKLPKYLKGAVDTTVAIVKKHEFTKVTTVDIYSTYTNSVLSMVDVYRFKHLEKRYSGYVCLGSGKDLALAAYHLTNNLTVAIETAYKFDQYTGLGVDIYSLRLNRFLKT